MKTGGEVHPDVTPGYYLSAPTVLSPCPAGLDLASKW